MNSQPYYEAPKTTSVMAIISAVSGAASFIILPFVGAIAALITGYIAKKEIRESNGRVEGEGFATAGIVMGWVNIGLSLMVCLLILLAIILMGAFTFRVFQ